MVIRQKTSQKPAPEATPGANLSRRGSGRRFWEVFGGPRGSPRATKRALRVAKQAPRVDLRSDFGSKHDNIWSIVKCVACLLSGYVFELCSVPSWLTCARKTRTCAKLRKHIILAHGFSSFAGPPAAAQGSKKPYKSCIRISAEKRMTKH